MRKQTQITQLEKQIADLQATVVSLLEVVTAPAKPAPIVETLDTPLFSHGIDVTKMRGNGKTVNTRKARMRWTEEEKKSLVKMFNSGLSYQEIGDLMGRSAESIKIAVSKLRRGK